MINHAEEVMRLFPRQADEFKGWFNTYFECAWHLHRISEETSPLKLAEFLEDNFTPDQRAICEDMLTKLRKTDTGKKIIAASTTEFVFPS